MRALIDAALELGWTLIAYESEDPRSPFMPDGTTDMAIVNAREEDQARSLAAALPVGPLLVWCGNSHLSKGSDGEWSPMGRLFRELTGTEYFAIDQTCTVFAYADLAVELRSDLEPLGGTAGMLTDELPEPFCRPDVDAMLFSVENALV